MTTHSSESDLLPHDTLVTRDHLEALFHGAEKAPPEFRIGAEAEKFGVDAGTGAPLSYSGARGIQRIFAFLAETQEWVPESETREGPLIALTRGGASITLEPGAQLELSGSPVRSCHDVDAEMRTHLRELEHVSRELGVVWLAVGFHPFARSSDLPWVPKQRYGVMRKYLPTRGARGVDMMQRTATVQANFDYCGESDAMAKLGVLLRLSPIVHAMTANSPFIEGRRSPRKSERGDVWLHMDPARSGLIPSLWKAEEPKYADYVEWALDAGMFLFRRGETFIRNTGQTFRDFLKNGFEGHRATYGDWVQHVNSLFPEARLKRTLEARACDVLPLRLMTSVPALFTGILYDAKAFDQARELTSRLAYAAVEAARPDLVVRGLGAKIGGEPVQPIAERILEIAAGGLSRRAELDPQGRDERVHLEALADLVARGRSPADDLTEDLADGDDDFVAEVIRRTRIDA